MRTSSRQARLELPMTANNYCQVYLALPMKAHSHRQLCLAQPVKPCARVSHRSQPRGVQVRRCKPGVSGAENLGTLLPIPLPASAEKLTAKQTVQVSAGGRQIGIGVQL